jgi:hypothetical protein
LAKVAGDALQGLVQQTREKQDRNSWAQQQLPLQPIAGQTPDSVKGQLSMQAFQSNQRLAGSLRLRDGVGDLPRFTIDAINTDGDKAIFEIGDLIKQVRANDPDQAHELLTLTAQGIGPENAHRLSVATAGEHAKSEPAPQTDKTSFLERLENRAAETRLDIKEGILRAGAGAGEAVGLDQASRYLKHFLDGSGKDIVVPRDLARKDPFIQKSEIENQRRFENETFLGETGNTDLNDKLRSIKDGQTIDLDDKWHRELSFGNLRQSDYSDELERLREPDRLLAIGSVKFESTIKARATRQGDVVRIEGTVTHSGNDKYDFADNGEAFGAYELQKSGRGKPFWVHQGWQQRVVGTVNIRGKSKEGKLLLGQPHFTWEDIN